jgi:acyl homoserine lactone synthase
LAAGAGQARLRIGAGKRMLAVIDRHNVDEYRGLVDEMFRLRARVFGHRLKWNVEIVDGMERDRFDDENPVYVIHTDEHQRVLGSLRILPTTGPTVLSEAFSDSLPDAANLSSPHIWECTRFCVDDGIVDRDRVTRTSGALIAALGEIGLSAGIQSYVGNFDAAMMRVYRRVGCDVEVLGYTDKYGRRVYLGLFPVSLATLRRVQSRLRGMDEILSWAPGSWQPSSKQPPSPGREPSTASPDR